MSAPRRPRPTEVDDLHELSRACFGFGGRDHGTERPPGRRARPVPRNARVIVLDGKPVSHIAVVYNHLWIEGARVKVASFGGVCTHPDYRGRGLATELMNYCLRGIDARGAALLIISGERGLYRRAHAVPAGPCWEVHLRPSELPASPDDITARRAGPEDWPAFARFYEAEPVRFARAARMYAHAVASESHRAVWLLEQAGRPVAYACLSHVWGLGPREPVRALSEYGGSRAALVDGLAALAAAAGLDEIRTAFPTFDTDLTYLLRRRGVELKQGTIPSHTFRIVNLPRLMRLLKAYLEARLTQGEARGLRAEQEGERCRLQLGEEEAELDLSRAGKLLLGGPGAPRVGGALGNALARIAPIPLPLPGLNYA